MEPKRFNLMCVVRLFIKISTVDAFSKNVTQICNYQRIQINKLQYKKFGITGLKSSLGVTEKYAYCLGYLHFTSRYGFQKHLPPSGLLLGGITLEQAESYRYLGVLVSSRLTWSDHIEHVCAKARKLVGMLYRQFYSWADSKTLLLIYRTCIRPHLEYICLPTLGPILEQGHAVTGSCAKICM